MKQEIPTWLGVLSLCGAAALALLAGYGFRKGMQIKNPPEGVPPERLN